MQPLSQQDSTSDDSYDHANKCGMKSDKEYELNNIPKRPHRLSDSLSSEACCVSVPNTVLTNTQSCAKPHTQHSSVTEGKQEESNAKIARLSHLSEPAETMDKFHVNQNPEKIEIVNCIQAGSSYHNTGEQSNVWSHHEMTMEPLLERNAENYPMEESDSNINGGGSHTYTAV